MLVEFRVKNFLSIQDEQCLSLVASSDKTHQDSCTFGLPETKITLLNSVAVYGANAAGKSSLIKAIKVMEEVVRNSSRLSQRGVMLPITPFLLGETSDKEPSIFEVTIFAKSVDADRQYVRYQYGFSATKEKIYDEWLFAYPQGRAQKWFERRYNSDTGDYIWYFGSSFRGAKEQWKELTRGNVIISFGRDSI